MSNNPITPANISAMRRRTQPPQPHQNASTRKPAIHRKGQIWMVTEDSEHPPVGTELWSNRPAVIVTNDTLNSRAGFAGIVYLSSGSRKQSGPTHIELHRPIDEKTTFALCEQVHTVDASRLHRHLGDVSENDLRSIEGAITLALNLGRGRSVHSLFKKWEEYIKLHGFDIAEEMRALAGRTADERVISLSNALQLMTEERDSWRTLYESNKRSESVFTEVRDALKKPSGPDMPRVYVGENEK